MIDTEGRRRQHLFKKKEWVGVLLGFSLNNKPLDAATIEPGKLKKMYSKQKSHFTLAGAIFITFPPLAQRCANNIR